MSVSSQGTQLSPHHSPGAVCPLREGCGPPHSLPRLPPSTSKSHIWPGRSAAVLSRCPQGSVQSAPRRRSVLPGLALPSSLPCHRRSLFTLVPSALFTGAAPLVRKPHCPLVLWPSPTHWSSVLNLEGTSCSPSLTRYGVPPCRPTCAPISSHVTLCHSASLYWSVALTWRETLRLGSTYCPRSTPRPSSWPAKINAS